MIQFPMTFDDRVRLLAAELQPLKQKDRRRQICTEAGRLAESVRARGAERWQAVRLEDAFAEAVHIRLAELDRIVAGHGTDVPPIAAIGGAA